MNLRLLFLPAAALLAATPGDGKISISETYSFPVTAPAGIVPDGIGSLTCGELVTGSQIQSLTPLVVRISSAGNPAAQAWAGDRFVSLNRNLRTQTAVPLAQAGVPPPTPPGTAHRVERHLSVRRGERGHPFCDAHHYGNGRHQDLSA